jgi:hypothetical protein
MPVSPSILKVTNCRILQCALVNKNCIVFCWGWAQYLCLRLIIFVTALWMTVYSSVSVCVCVCVCVCVSECVCVCVYSDTRNINKIACLWECIYSNIQGGTQGGWRDAAPPPNPLKPRKPKFKIHRLCRYYDIKSFT